MCSRARPSTSARNADSSSEPATGRRIGDWLWRSRQRHVDRDDVLLEFGAAQNRRAVRRDTNRVAVEDQLVVAADLVDVEEVAAVLDCLLRHEAPPDIRHCPA